MPGDRGWTVPPVLHERARDDAVMRRWLVTVPDVAAEVCQSWRLVADGPVMAGFLSLVRPVRDHDGRALVLKLFGPEVGAAGEPAFLRAAAGPAVVELVRADLALGALLLDRLDPARTLATEPDVDVACAVVGDLVRQITAHRAPAGMRSMADELDRLHASITSMLDRTPEVLPRALADRAVETCAELSRRLRQAPGEQPLVHGDLHFENVLHTRAGEAPRWVAIDPLPAAGYPEWEVTASLRNRWPDAVATGNPERALRRRVAIIAEAAGFDRARAVAIAQAVAVDNVLWLSRAGSHVHPVVRGFVPPYLLVASWTG
ncbi:MAG: aminoglycoside phosphotransferase family protein [Lapillicoccus sp.]